MKHPTTYLRITGRTFHRWVNRVISLTDCNITRWTIGRRRVVLWWGVAGRFCRRITGDVGWGSVFGCGVDVRGVFRCTTDTVVSSCGWSITCVQSCRVTWTTGLVTTTNVVTLRFVARASIIVLRLCTLFFYTGNQFISNQCSGPWKM